MNLRWLEDFLAVCETRSFTEAARSRFLTQSALSKHMQALEVWLGAGTLLDRSTNPVGITSAGLAFKQTAAQIVTLLNSARRAALNHKVAAGKSIYVSSTHSLSATFVPLLSKLVYDELPDETVCLHVAANNFREALARYERAECDYFVCYDSPIHGVDLDHDEHSKLTLGTDYLVPVSIAKQGGKPYYAIIGAGERPLPYLGYTEESHLGKVLENHPGFTRLADRLVAHAKSAYSETLRAGVLTGLGIAWLPYSLIRGNLEGGELTLASTDVAHYIPLTIDVYRQRRAAREEVLRCWEIWRSHLGSLNYLTPELPGIDERSRSAMDRSQAHGTP